jgi:hypothetical protein
MLACPLLNHLVRTLQHRRRNRQAEHRSGREVDHQLKPRGLFDRNVGGLGPKKEFSEDAGGLPSDRIVVRAIGDKTTVVRN